MVSLINFRSVNEDLQREPHEQRKHEFKYQRTNNDSHNRTYIRVTSSQATNEPDEVVAATTTNNDQANKSQQQIAQKHNLALQPLKPFNGQEPPAKPAAAHTSVDLVPNFVVTWRNLEFLIEPKWHQKLIANPAGCLNPLSASNKRRAQKQSKLQDHYQASQEPAVKTKIVLDKLDGSFRSGELTAILGPSGK